MDNESDFTFMRKEQKEIKEKLKHRLDFVFLGNFHIDTIKETLGRTVNIYLRDERAGDSYKFTFDVYALKNHQHMIINRLCDAVLSERSKQSDKTWEAGKNER